MHYNYCISVTSQHWYFFASAVVASTSWQHHLQLHVEASDRLCIWPVDRSSQYGPWSKGLHMSILVTLSAPTHILKLCICLDLCGNGSTANSEVACIGADFRFEVPGQSSVGLIGGGRGQWLRGHHGESGARAYNGGLGAELPAGSRGRSPGRNEAESILVIGCPTAPANLAPLVKFSK